MRMWLNFIFLFMCIVVSSQAKANDFTFRNNISFFTEYYTRGITQTKEQPSPKFATSIHHKSGFFTGLIAWRVEFLDNDAADQEIDFFVAYQNTINQLYYRLGAIYYAFPSSSGSLDYNFWEFDLGLGYDFGPFYSEVSIKKSPNHFASTGRSRYSKIELHIPVVENRVKIKSHLAHRYVENKDKFGLPDNFDWEIGSHFTIAKNTDFILKYVDSSFTKDECPRRNFCKERLIAGLSYNF